MYITKLIFIKGRYILILSEKRTALTRVVHEDDLLQQRSGRSVYYGPDCPQQSGPRLVVENYHDARIRKILGIFLILTTLESDVLQRSVQGDHVAGHQVELIQLEQLLLLGLVLWRDVHRRSHLAGVTLTLLDDPRRPPYMQLGLRILPLGARLVLVLERLRLPDRDLRMQLGRLLGLKRLLLLIIIRAVPSGPSDAIRIEHEHHNVDQEPYQRRQQYHLTCVDANLEAKHLSTTAVLRLYHELLITQSLPRDQTRDLDPWTRLEN